MLFNEFWEGANYRPLNRRQSRYLNEDDRRKYQREFDPDEYYQRLTYLYDNDGVFDEYINHEYVHKIDMNMFDEYANEYNKLLNVLFDELDVELPKADITDKNFIYTVPENVEAVYWLENCETRDDYIESLLSDFYNFVLNFMRYTSGNYYKRIIDNNIRKMNGGLRRETPNNEIKRSFKNSISYCKQMLRQIRKLKKLGEL